MKKQLLLLSSLLSASLLASCAKNEPDGPKDGDKVILNSFENMQDVYRTNALKTSYDSRATVSINHDEKYITNGSGSMHLKTQKDSSSAFEFMQFFETAACGKVRLDLMSAIEFDVYNASNFDSKCFLTLYCDDDCDTLLSFDQELPKKSESSNFVHLTFNLSKIAVNYNVSRLRGVAFKVINNGNGDFYFDNLTLTYNSKLSGDDEKYNDQINEIIADIDSLGGETTLDQEGKLRSIGEKIASLPVLYRTIIPNMEKYDNACQEFSELIRPISINYDKEIFLPNAEFYGRALYGNVDANSTLSFFYDLDHKFNNESASTRIAFNGSTQSGFVVNGLLSGSLQNFDYVTFTMRFEVPETEKRGISMWLNGTNRYIIYPNVDTTYTISTKILNNNSFTLFLHQQGINSSNDLVDPILSSIGNLYMSNFYAYGRSIQTLKVDAQKAILKVPSYTILDSEQQIVKHLSIIKECEAYLNNKDLMKAYPDLFTSEQTNNLRACMNKVSEYGLVFGTDDKTNSYVFWYYGVPFESKVISNDDYGSVFSNLVTNNIKPQKEQYFKTSGAGNNATLYEENFFYIYNPTEYEFMCAVKDTDWVNFTSAIKTKLAPKSWTKVSFSPDVFTYAYDKCVAIGLNVEGNAEQSPVPVGGVNGEWLISSIYGHGRISAERINNEISSLPNPATIENDKMSIIRYSEKIRQAYKEYGYLPSSEQAKISASNTQKIFTLYELTTRYDTLYDKVCEKGGDYDWDGEITQIDNDYVGGCYQIKVDEVRTHPVNNVTGFQVLFQSGEVKPKSGSTIGFFFIYNPTDTTYSGTYSPNNWDKKTPLVLPAKSWTEISFNVAYYGKVASILMIDQGENPPLDHTTWLVSYMYCE